MSTDLHHPAACFLTKNKQTRIVPGGEMGLPTRNTKEHVRRTEGIERLQQDEVRIDVAGQGARGGTERGFYRIRSLGLL